MQAMRMTTVPKALLWKRIKAVEPRVASPAPTLRRDKAP